PHAVARGRRPAVPPARGGLHDRRRARRARRSPGASRALGREPAPAAQGDVRRAAVSQASRALPQPYPRRAAPGLLRDCRVPARRTAVAPGARAVARADRALLLAPAARDIEGAEP